MDITVQAVTLFLQVAFATWYLAYAITSTHGPFGIFDKARKVTALGGLLECPICLAPWIAFILLNAPYGVLTQAFAVAGVAMILHGWSGWRFAQ